MPRYVPGIPRSRPGLAVLAALSTVTVAVTPLAAAPPAAASAPATAAAPAAAAAAGRPLAAAARSLMLINGQQISLLPGPGGRLSVTAMAPSDDSFLAVDRFVFCGQFAEIPAAAVPFFGRGLDPSLFLIRPLQRAEHGGRRCPG